jgi:hypothetical protein
MKLPMLQMHLNVSSSIVTLNEGWRGQITSFLNKSYEDWIDKGKVNEYRYTSSSGILHCRDFEKVRHPLLRY